MKRLFQSVLCLSVLAGVAACSNPDWNEHYASHVDGVLEETVLEALENEPSVSSFLSLLKETGQQDLLSRSQSFTVWAPNNAAMATANLTTDYDKRVFVLNHISRFPYTTTNINNGEVKIRMMDNKRVVFSRQGNDFYFGENRLITKDMALKNGILHIIDGYVPYSRNIWEFIQFTPGFDSIATYFAKGDYREFDEENSEVLTIVNGQSVYDSIFIERNERLHPVGQIKDEDSIYTMIVPTNEAWTTIIDSLRPYNHYSPYTVERNKRTGDYEYVKEDPAVTDSLEKQNIYDLVTGRLCFKGAYTAADLQTVERIEFAGRREGQNSIAALRNPAYYFEGMNDTVVSNGVVFIANELHFPTSFWRSTFSKEAEKANSKFPRSYDTMQDDEKDQVTVEQDARSIYVLRSDGTNSSWLNDRISGHSYIQVVGNYPAARPVVDFKCHDKTQRSTSYNIYCVFLPRNVSRRDMDSSLLLPTKVTFRVSYTNPEDGSPFDKEYRTPRTTNPYDIDTMCVTQDALGNSQPIAFPYGTDDIYLRVSSAVGGAEELSSYITDMYIDEIIFQPVENE